MPRRKGIPKTTITTTIPVDLWKWAQENNLSWTRLLESAIQIHKNAFEEGIEEDYTKHLKKRIEKFSDKITKFSMFISNKGLLDEFSEFEGKKI